jgi:hypothetical protein
MPTNKDNITISKEEYRRLLKKAGQAEQNMLCLIKGHKWIISPGSDYCSDTIYCERCGLEERW